MQGAGSGMRAASSARKRGSSSSAPYKAPSRRASGPRVKPRPASANRSMPMATMALQFGEASAKPASRGMPRRKNGQALSPLPQRQGQHRAGMAHSKSTASMHRFSRQGTPSRQPHQQHQQHQQQQRKHSSGFLTYDLRASVSVAALGAPVAASDDAASGGGGGGAAVRRGSNSSGSHRKLSHISSTPTLHLGVGTGAHSNHSNGAAADLGVITTSGGGGGGEGSDAVRFFRVPSPSNGSKGVPSQRTFKSDVLDLEVALSERLRRLDAATRYTEHAQAERLLVFRQLFDAIIERDTKFGPLLSQVKEAYEEWIGLPKQAAASVLDSNFDAKVLAELHQAKSANAELQRQLDELRSGAAAAAAVDERRSKSPSGLEAENAALKELVQSLQRRCDRLEDGGRRGGGDDDDEERGGYSGHGGGSGRGSGGGDVNERPAVLGGFSLAIPSRQQAHEPHAHDRISPASSLSSPLSDRSVPFEFSPDPKPGGVVPKLALNSKAMTSGDIQSYHDEFASHQETFSKSWREAAEEMNRRGAPSPEPPAAAAAADDDSTTTDTAAVTTTAGAGAAADVEAERRGDEQ